MKKVIIFLMIVLSYQYITSQNNGSYFIKNANINDTNTNFGTTFYGTDIAFYASSRSKNGGDLEFYYGFIDEYGDIIDSKVLGRKVNSKYDEVDMVFTRDYKTVYFTRRSNEGHMELFKAKVSKVGVWSKIRRLPFNRGNISIGHPALSNSDKVLYFSSDMRGSAGGFDIFKVRVLSENTYGKPKRLGSRVNTEGNETTPFILGSTLYFASDGRGGLGGFDIFSINLVNEYATAKNIGKPINSTHDDYGYVQSRSIGLGYFTSSRTSGKGGDDIYSFQKLDDDIPDNTQNDVVAKTDEVTIIPEKEEVKSVASKKEANTKRERALKAERINKKRREKKKAAEEKAVAAKKVLAEKKAAEEKTVAARKVLAEKKVAEEKAVAARKVLAEKKAAEEKAVAAKKVLAEKKAAEEKAVAARKVLAEKKVAEEKAVAAKKVLAEKKAVEEKAVAARKVLAEKKVAEEKAVAARKVLAEKKVAEEKAVAARKVLAEKKAAEEKAVAAKKVLADKKVAEEKVVAAKKVLAEKKAAEEKAVAAKKVLAEKKAAEEKAVAAKKVLADKKVAEEKAVAVVQKNIVKKTPKPKQKDIFKNKTKYITAYQLCQFQFDNLNSVYFDFKKSYVNAKIANEVDKLIRIMKRCPNIVAIVSSHTDSRSSATFNIKLSQRRSDAIVTYILQNSNLTTRRVKSVGYGETKLRNKCTDKVWCSEAEHKVNRRTQFESRTLN